MEISALAKLNQEINHMIIHMLFYSFMILYIHPLENMVKSNYINTHICIYMYIILDGHRIFPRSITPSPSFLPVPAIRRLFLKSLHGYMYMENHQQQIKRIRSLYQ